MAKITKNCEYCGEELKPSQYVRQADEGFPKATDNPACRNYPNCPKAEKEVDSKDKI